MPLAISIIAIDILPEPHYIDSWAIDAICQLILYAMPLITPHYADYADITLIAIDWYMLIDIIDIADIDTPLISHYIIEPLPLILIHYFQLSYWYWWYYW